jgi:hypothetical protein
MAEDAYYSATRPLRRATHEIVGRVRWRFFAGSLAVCDTCAAAPAVWDYMPSGPSRQYCDDCVPRGCGCNLIGAAWPDEAMMRPADGIGNVIFWADHVPAEHRDERGRKLPCCEYDFDRWGFSKPKES